ncbi:hypothetical protein C2845_PM07G18320 [Panicum miliaceum]|uniref:Uncharacterized protein n=1 Tax=Panicum miliaceum TaxID=4540 RepID=A0A3L6SNV2_PANMI|nr:hypothetical protein C2845_PM07G18320 [Panicum miliaceum]
MQRRWRSIQAVVVQLQAYKLLATSRIVCDGTHQFHQNGGSSGSRSAVIVVVVVVAVRLRHPSSRAARPIARRGGVNGAPGGRNAAALDEVTGRLRRHWCHGSVKCVRLCKRIASC